MLGYRSLTAMQEEEEEAPQALSIRIKGRFPHRLVQDITKGRLTGAISPLPRVRVFLCRGALPAFPFSLPLPSISELSQEPPFLVAARG